MPESDKVLLRRYHEEGDLSAREQLIEQYMSLVRSLARRYAYRGEQLDDLVVSLSADDGVLRASLGPFAPEKVHATDSDGGLDLRRVLETVCDTHEVEERDDGTWVELSKRIAATAGSGDGGGATT